MRDKRRVRNAGGLASRDDIDLARADLRLGVFGEFAYDVFTLFWVRKNFSAIDIDGRYAARDKNKRLVLVDLNRFRL
jgi:hypothetical protein